MKLPESIQAYILEWFAGHHRLGYLIVDFKGRLVSWDGPLSEMGINNLVAGQPAADTLSCLIGVLPLQGPTLQMPLIKTRKDRTVDIHIFRIKTGYGILFVDRTERERRLAELIQKANARALTWERLHKKT